MKKVKLKYVLSLALSTVMIAAATIPFISTVVEATSATTYTTTINADMETIRCQDGYLPETTYDRIGLSAPQDMVIDVVNENGKDVEYGYILNKGVTGENPFILKFRLDDVVNTVQKIELTGRLNYVNEPTGLWIQTTTVNGITQKEMYIADGSASYTDKTDPALKATEADKALNLSDGSYTYNGLIYRVPFDTTSNQLLWNKYDYIHEPTNVVTKEDYSMYELKTFETLEEFADYQIIATDNTVFKAENKDSSGNVISYNRVVCKAGEKCEERIVPLGQYIMNTPSFGQETVFNPKKVAVDESGNIFVASSGTASGMIQMSYSGEFVSFFVVNPVAYDWLYQFIKNFGTDEQLDKLQASSPQSFSNVFVDHNNLVYSVTTGGTKIFDKYSTSGSSILEYELSAGTGSDVTDAYVTTDGLIFLVLKTGNIAVCAPTGQIIFQFGNIGTNTSTPSIVGFFQSLQAIVVDHSNRIWVVDEQTNYLQTFSPTDYTKSIFDAIISFNNHEYEASRKAWEEVLQYDSLSVLANDGLGKAYYYDLDFDNSLKYFSVSKNRALYSNVFWELRNDYLQDNLATIIIIAVAVIAVIILAKFLFNKVKVLKDFKEKFAKVKDFRFVKDLTVGFRLIKKPNDTFYEINCGRRGSMLTATIYYILAIIAFLLHTYCYALPFQVLTANMLNPSTVLFAVIVVFAIFVLCNYLVSAINDGEGTFKDIYKFTAYSLLPMIICLPIAVGISYGLTLNEQVVLTILQAVGFWGSGILLVIGILETHNYTFGQTVKNIFLTIVFMILFLIICMVIVIMFDQIRTLIETIWKEVKLRAGWY